jgi:hypothetical protein
MQTHADLTSPFTAEEISIEHQAVCIERSSQPPRMVGQKEGVTAQLTGCQLLRLAQQLRDTTTPCLTSTTLLCNKHISKFVISTTSCSERLQHSANISLVFRSLGTI